MRRIGLAVVLALGLLIAPLAAVAQQKAMPVIGRFYFGVYARGVGRLTLVYMAFIDPFRKLIVDPSLLRSVRASRRQAFAEPPSTAE